MSLFISRVRAENLRVYLVFSGRLPKPVFACWGFRFLRSRPGPGLAKGVNWQGSKKGSGVRTARNRQSAGRGKRPFTLYLIKYIRRPRANIYAEKALFCFDS